MKKKVQKRIIGRALKANRLYAKRYPHIGATFLEQWQSAVTRECVMVSGWGPLTKRPWRKPLPRVTA